MKNILVAVIGVLIIYTVISSNLGVTNKQNAPEQVQQHLQEIRGTIKKGETLYDIFRRYKLDIGELLKLKEASADIHRLKELCPGRTYKILLDDNKAIDSFIYRIDDDSILHVTRTGSGFCAEKKSVEYEKRILQVGGIVRENLISSIGEGRENLMLAFQLSDIFAWNIDFNTDLRNEDVYKIVVEGFYSGGEFKKYGNILSAEFVNNGETYRAYRFEQNGAADFYDAGGKSLRRAFLKAPLNFRRISSAFSERRFHPILRIYRPHHGLDYSAPAGTPVSAVGDGTVLYAGLKGQYGKLVVIRHKNNWKTYYGHLSRIVKGLTKGKKIEQGQVIGYVGSTGLATGPHLHYGMMINDRPVDPLKVKSPQRKSVAEPLLPQFRSFENQMDRQLAAITPRYYVKAGKDGNSKI